jgi:hypothetical protein
MQLLIALFVFLVGFMVFGSLVYGAAKLFFNKKPGLHDLHTDMNRNKSINLRVNKTHTAYSFK